MLACVEDTHVLVQGALAAAADVRERAKHRKTRSCAILGSHAGNRGADRRQDVARTLKRVKLI